MTPDDRRELRAALLAELIAGDTRTPRESVVGNAEKLAAGDPDKMLGFSFDALTPHSVLGDVAALCGCSADLALRDGPGVIDPERTIDALAAVEERLRRAERRGERVLVATGHPTGLMPVYQALTRALAARGCKILTPLSNVKLAVPPGERRRGDRVRFLDGVACLTDGANLYHTHESWPMQQLLEAAEEPDLVLADHGFAGAAIVRGVETLAFADVNDPALAVAKARGLTTVVVPLDDNVAPEHYAPITRFLLSRIA